MKECKGICTTYPKLPKRSYHNHYFCRLCGTYIPKVMALPGYVCPCCLSSMRTHPRKRQLKEKFYATLPEEDRKKKEGLDVDPEIEAEVERQMEAWRASRYAEKVNIEQMEEVIPQSEAESEVEGLSEKSVAWEGEGIGAQQEQEQGEGGTGEISK